MGPQGQLAIYVGDKQMARLAQPQELPLVGGCRGASDGETARQR